MRRLHELAAGEPRARDADAGWIRVVMWPLWGALGSPGHLLSNIQDNRWKAQALANATDSNHEIGPKLPDLPGNNNTGSNTVISSLSKCIPIIPAGI